MKLLAWTVLCLVLVGILFSLATRPAAAFEPWNIPNWPGIAPGGSPMTAKVGPTATVTWGWTDSYGYPDWRRFVSRALDTGSDDPESYGNVINRLLASEGRGSITVRENRAGEQPDIIHNAVPTPFLEAKCGDWATACVYLLNPLPVPAFYKAANMVLWGYRSQAAVVRHEFHHPVGLACDQYKGACPRTIGGYDPAIVCTGNPDTLMDCGGAAATVQRFDYETFKSAYPASTGFLQIVPVAPPCVPVGDIPCWNPVTGRHEFASGRSWAPGPTAYGTWFNAAGVAVWAECDPIFNNRYSPQQLAWYPITGQAAYFALANLYWEVAPAC